MLVQCDNMMKASAYVVNGLIIQVLGGDSLLDDLLLDLFSQLLGGDVLAMLG